MPLSEHEERILAEIERNLQAEDPRFVQRARRVAGAPTSARRLRWAVAGFVVGLVSLLGLTFHIAFGFAGFALMLVSVVVGAEALRAAMDSRGGDLLTRLRSAFGSSDDAEL